MRPLNTKELEYLVNQIERVKQRAMMNGLDYGVRGIFDTSGYWDISSGPLSEYLGGSCRNIWERSAIQIQVRPDQTIHYIRGDSWVNAVDPHYHPAPIQSIPPLDADAISRLDRRIKDASAAAYLHHEPYGVRAMYSHADGGWMTAHNVLKKYQQDSSSELGRNWATSEVQIAIDTQKVVTVLRGAEFVPHLKPQQVMLWWQKEDQETRELREKNANLHKEIRRMLGDPD